MSRSIVSTAVKQHGDEFPPSRPTPLLFLIAAIVVAAVALMMNWPAVASFTHFQQIRSSFGL
jgi:hypothetical protein